MNIASLMVDTMLYNSDSQEDKEITLWVLDDANRKHPLRRCTPQLVDFRWALFDAQSASL